MLVMDGYGDDGSTSAYVGRGNRLERHWSTSFLNSLGLVYTFVTEHLGFAGFGDEGKVMALAAFGEDTYVERFRDVVHLTPDGGYAVNMDYFSYDAFGPAPALQAASSPTRSGRRAPARAAHRSAPRPGLRPAGRDRGGGAACRARAAAAPSQRDLCMVGGVALNCVANAKILEQTDVRRIWVPPCASDTGAPLGSALWHYHQTLGHAARLRADACRSTARPTATEHIQRALQRAGLRYQRMPGRPAAAPRGAGPGRRQDRGMVPGPLRDGSARARQPLDPGRSAARATCATSSTTRSSSASPSARSRLPCCSSTPPSTSRSTSPIRS